MTFVQLGDVFVRASSVYAIAPSPSGSTVYAGSAPFPSELSPEEVVALLDEPAPST